MIEDVEGWGEYKTFTVPTVKVSLSPKSLRLGEKFTVDVSISPALEERYSFTIIFDEKILSRRSVRDHITKHFYVLLTSVGDHTVKFSICGFLRSAKLTVTGQSLPDLMKSTQDLQLDVSELIKSSQDIRSDTDKIGEELSTIRILSIAALAIAIGAVGVSFATRRGK